MNPALNTAIPRWVHYTAIGAIVLAGLTVTLVAFEEAQVEEREETRNRFLGEARNFCSALAQEIKSSLYAVESLHALYDSSVEVSPSGFCNFTSTLLAQHVAIQAFEWIPRVTDAERDKYESLRRQDGYPLFQFTERSSQGDLVRAGRRDEYFPVYFVEPYRGNEAAMGYDLASSKTRNVALRRAQETGRTTITERLLLMQETASQYGYLVFTPVYRPGVAVESAEARRKHLSGFVLGVFKVSDVLTAALTHHSAQGIEMAIYDMSAPASESFLCSHPAHRAESKPPEAPGADANTVNGLSFRATMAVADRTWVAVCKPSAGYVAAVDVMTPLGILFVGLFFSGTVGYFLFASARRAEVIKKTVLKRTSELQACNRSLENEIQVRRSMERALEESEIRLRLLLDSTAEGIYGIDMAGNCTFINPAGLRLLGYKHAAELLGKNMHWQIHHKRLDGKPFPVEECRIFNAFEKGEGTHAEDEVLWRADGTCFPAEYWSYPQRQDGVVIGAVVTFIDITERSRTDERLRQSEGNLSTFFDTINDLVFVLDPQGNILRINKTTELRLGYTETEIRGRSVLEVHPEDKREEAGRIVADMLAGTVDFCPVPLVAKDGTLIPVETRVVLGVWDGQPALFGVSKDVGDLRASEEKFSKAFQGNPSPMAISSVPDGRFLDVNEAFVRITGYTREEVIGSAVFETNLLADSMQKEEIRAVFSSGKRLKDFEVAIRNKSGEIGYGLLSGEVFRLQDRNVWLTVMIDVTERKRMEKRETDRLHILEMLAHNLPQSEVLDFIVRLIEAEVPNSICSILLISQDGKRLLCGATPNLPDFYNKAIDGLEIGDGVGSCGTAAFTKKTVIVEDVETHPYWAAFRELTRRVGVRACWSEPIVTATGNVLGTFAIYYREPHAPDRDDIQRIQFAASVTSLVIEHKHVEARLKLITDRLTLAVQAGGVGVWDYDVVNNQLVWDDQMFHLYGITADQFGGAYEAWQAGLHPEDRRRGDEEIQRALQGEKDFDTEFRVVWPDGSIHHIRALAIVRRDASGKPLQVVGTNWEITVQKQTETRLRTFMSAVDQSSVSVTITNANRVIEYVNPTFTKQTGYTPAEVIGRTPGMFQSGVHPHEFYEELWRTLQTDRVWQGEFCNKKKDGTLFWESAAIAQIRDDKGEVIHFVAVKEDITERRRIGEELRLAKETADVASKAKSEFLANMSHEIRTPMNAILGYSQLLLRDATLSGEAREKLRIIDRSGDHLLQLINDVLEMSKIEAGRMTVDPSLWNLKAMLDDLAVMFRLRTEVKELSFEMMMDGETPSHIRADEGKVRQILMNLLSNAVKFTDRGGIILRARMRQESPGQWRLGVEVEDTGTGISAEEQAGLFLPFEQTRSGRNKQAGTGLGLTISRQYARAMGGDITVASHVNKGSVFRLEIPVSVDDGGGVKERREERRRVIGLKPGGAPVRVLVADDNEENRNYLKTLLGLTGFEVRVAVNGEEAVRVWEEWEPQLILMDMLMPVMDGYEAARRIKAQPEGKAALIFAVTASVLDKNQTVIQNAGMDAFVSKPVKETELFGMIQQYLGVDYVYAENDEVDTAAAENSAVSPAALAKLPVELVEQMRTAAGSGKMKQLRQLTQQAANYDEPLAKRLRALADRYDHEALLKLLTQEAGSRQ